MRLGSKARLHVLWILGELPLPADSGSRLRTMGLLRELAPRHDVTTAVLQPDERGRVHIPELQDLCKDVVMLPWGGRPNRVRLLAGASVRFFAKLPYSVIKYCGREAETTLRDLAQRPFDLVQCENIGFRRYLPDEITAPRILATQNVESQVWRRRAALAGNPLLRAYLLAQAHKMARYERWLINEYDAAVAVSEEDAHTLEKEYGARHIAIVPNGVDTDRFSPRGESEPGLVVFSGAMDYAPNDDGIRYFLAEIWPAIIQRSPNARLVVAGREPSKALQRAATRSSNVKVTGWVPDMRPYLARAAVVVAPLRMGGGSRLKILEAMAMGKAVVSTTLGAEGLRVQAGEHLLIADTVVDFAEKTCFLLGQMDISRGLGTSARALVATEYGWPACADKLESFWRWCQETSANRTRGAKPGG